jgi:hypothetical protein
MKEKVVAIKSLSSRVCFRLPRSGFVQPIFCHVTEAVMKYFLTAISIACAELYRRSVGLAITLSAEKNPTSKINVSPLDSPLPESTSAR